MSDDQQPRGPKTMADVVAHMHGLVAHIDESHERLATIFDRQDQDTPELHTPVINPSASATGPFVVTDIAKWEALSIGLLNPSNYPVYLGIGGVSTASNSRAISCPPLSVLVLPLRVYDLELGCPTLGANALPLYVFRYSTVQKLFLGTS